jgi:hypothetical protein
MNVDDITPAADEERKGARRYLAYSSPLASFPLTRSRLGGSLDVRLGSSRGSAIFAANNSDIDGNGNGDSSEHAYVASQQQRNLSLITRLVDPKKRLCQYEVPGGGECRDGSCEDIHLGRLLESEAEN